MTEQETRTREAQGLQNVAEARVESRRYQVWDFSVSKTQPVVDTTFRFSRESEKQLANHISAAFDKIADSYVKLQIFHRVLYEEQGTYQLGNKQLRIIPK